ncbi:MAG: Beta-barrel assembly-enhancing protease [Firmicutes bacterium]|nr:Beta-barrel assembly-enhancing protease [Bacillota bacterium]
MTDKYTPEQLERIINVCRNTLARDAKNATAHHDLGVALMQKSAVDEAITHFLQAVKLAPAQSLGHYLLGIAYAEKNMFQEAITAWQHVVKLDKKNVGAHYFLGKVYALQGMSDAALLHLRKAKALQPSNPLIYHTLAEVHVLRRESRDAEAEWKAVLLLRPEDPRALINLCALCLDQGDYQKCIDYGQDFLASNRDDSRVRFNLGLAHLRLGDIAAAALHLEQAAVLAPADADILLALREVGDQPD